jgi:Ser/Thr protein kinase RdoA (MazF antagonist)
VQSLRRCGVELRGASGLVGGVASTTLEGWLDDREDRRVVVRMDRRKASEHHGDWLNAKAASECGVSVPSAPRIINSGSFTYSIRSYYKGKRVTESRRLSSLGRAFGLVHRANAAHSRASVYLTIHDDIEHALMSGGRPSDLQQPRAVIAKARQSGLLDELLTPSTHLTHGDLALDNVLQLDEGSIMVLDWEKSGSCSVEFDLAVAIYQLASYDGCMSTSALGAFLSSYMQVNDCFDTSLTIEALDIASAVGVVRDWTMATVNYGDARRIHYERFALPAYQSFCLSQTKATVRELVS